MFLDVPPEDLWLYVVKLNALFYSFKPNTAWWEVFFFFTFLCSESECKFFFLACLREISVVLLCWRLTGVMRHRQLCCKKVVYS